MKGNGMTTSDRREPGFEKEVVTLPDGRRLVFYAFPEPARDAPAAPPPPDPPRERRGR